jgi:hypothetical protein
MIAGKFQANLGIFAPMKELKSILIAAVLSLGLAAGTAFAQPTLVDPVEVFEGTLADTENAEIVIHWDVTNLTEDSLTLKVTRNIEQLVSPYNLPYNAENEGAYDRFCWGPLCYPYGTFSSFDSEFYLVTLPPQETDSTFFADYYPAGVAGVTAFEYCFHPVDDIDAGTCQMVLFCLDADNCALDVGDLTSSVDAELIFPQPVTGISSFPYHLNGATSAEMTIHGSSGRIVESAHLTAQHGVVYIDASLWEVGMYIITLQTDDGGAISERFVVTR